MKKILSLIILLLIPLFICSCEKRTFGIEEVNASAMVGYLLDTEKSNIIMAIYNEQDPNYQEFLSILDNISKEINQKIYVINANHLDSMSSIILIDGMELEYEKLIYVVYKDGEEVIYNYFNTYETILNDLKDYKSPYKLDLDNYKTLNEEQYLKESRENYEKGYISQAYESLNYIWPSDKAKVEYDNNKLYKIIKSWSAYSVSKKGNIVINSFLFTTGTNAVYICEKEGTKEEAPGLTMADYTLYYYYIKDDIIYLSKDKNGEYKKGYTIKKIEQSNLILDDGKKTYNLTPQL